MARRLGPLVATAATGILIVSLLLLFHPTPYSRPWTLKSIVNGNREGGKTVEGSNKLATSNASAYAESSYEDDEETEDVQDTTSAPVLQTSLISTLVVASLAQDNVGWVESELADKISSGSLIPAIYVVDDPSAPLHPPQNKGNEAMVYLTHIIDNYDNLSDVTIFMHAHRWAMHNQDLLHTDAVSMLQRFSPDRVEREGFVNMRCHWDGRCNAWARSKEPVPEEAQYVIESWPHIFPGTPVPPNLATPCCGQIAVSRAQIRKFPREYYLGIRQWLIDTEFDNYTSGRVLEFTWQYVFMAQPVYCPTTDSCYCDTYGICFGSQELIDEYFALRALRSQQEDELRKLKKQREEWHEQLSKEEGERPSDNDNDELYGVKVLEREAGLRAGVKFLTPELDRRLHEALERGDDPQERARSAGRQWSVGDGF